MKGPLMRRLFCTTRTAHNGSAHSPQADCRYALKKKTNNFVSFVIVV